MGTVVPTLASTRARRKLEKVTYADDDLDGIDDLPPGKFLSSG